MSDPLAGVYDRFASYQWSRLDVRRAELHVHLHYLDSFLPPGSRVLDIGAGPGRYALELARRGHRVVLGDLSPEQVRMARERAAAEEDPEVRARIEGVELMDACDLWPLAAGSFDAVVAFGPYYHLKDETARRRAATEAARVLRAGGLLFATFMPRPFWLGLALRQYLQQEAPAGMVDHLAEFWATGSLTRLKSDFLKSCHFCRLEEIDPLLAGAGYCRRRMVASNGIAAGWPEASWLELERRGVLDRVLRLVLATAEEPSLLGMSDQVLWIGAKEEA